MLSLLEETENAVQVVAARRRQPGEDDPRELFGRQIEHHLGAWQHGPKSVGVDHGVALQKRRALSHRGAYPNTRAIG